MESNNQIFFWGSKPLGLRCFNFLLHLINDKYRNFKITGVVISEKDLLKDGKKGQDIRTVATKHQIQTFTERNTNDFEGDIGIAIGYPHKIPLGTIKKFNEGIVNLHFGPLPYYRGSKTLSHAILNKETRYGVTLHYIDKDLDTGPIIAIKWIDLPLHMGLIEIEKLLEELAFGLFQEYLPTILNRRVISISQKKIIDKEKIKPKFYTRNSLDNLYAVSLEEGFDNIYTKIRALESKKRRPYFENNGRRIYLSLVEN